MASGWNETTIVEVEYPGCPSCGHVGYIRVRTESAGDGTQFHKAVCRECGRHYKVFYPLPPWGNQHFDEE